MNHDPAKQSADAVSLSAGGLGAAAVLVAGARAGLIAARDGYFAAGLWWMAGQSFCRDLLWGSLAAVLGALVAAPAGLWVRRHAPALLAPWWAVTVAAATLFVVTRLPYDDFTAPEWDLGLGLLVHAAGAAVAVVAVAHGAPTREPRSPSRRVAGFAAAGALAGAATLLLLPVTGRSWPDRPNVVLISLDTLRADHLGCYGYEQPTSPELDRFARQATRFTRAFCPQPWTLTSHMSMLTSLSPSAHAVGEGQTLAPEVLTLAQAFREAGYRTAAVVDTVPFLSPSYGFDRGFDLYRRVQGSAAGKNDRVRRLLDDLKGGPFFLFLHYFDVHSDFRKLPYDADPEDQELLAGWYDGDFDGCRADLGCASRLLEELNGAGETLEGDERRYVVSLYDAGIRSMDRQLGVLFRTLERRRLMQNMVVAVTADHGEEFFEHGKALHGQYHDETLRVPLLVRTPETRKARSVDALVSLMDLAPSLAELAGLQPEFPQGASFAAAVTGGPAPARDHVLIDHGRGNLSVRTATHKLLWDQGTYRLFDLREDPGEQHDLLEQGGSAAELAALRKVLEDEAAALDALRGTENPHPGLSAAERELLRALGYTGQ